MPLHAEADVQRELASGERLLWSGRPVRVLDRPTVGKVVLYLAFTGVGLVSLIVFHAWVFGLVFTGASAIWLVYHLVITPWNRSRQLYGLTTRRVLIIHRGFGRRVEELLLHTMRAINVQLEE